MLQPFSDVSLSSQIAKQMLLNVVVSKVFPPNLHACPTKEQSSLMNNLYFCLLIENNPQISQQMSFNQACPEM